MSNGEYAARDSSLVDYELKSLVLLAGVFYC